MSSSRSPFSGKPNGGRKAQPKEPKGIQHSLLRLCADEPHPAHQRADEPVTGGKRNHTTGRAMTDPGRNVLSNLRADG